MSTLPTRTPGPERLAVTALGLGCWGMARVYGPADDAPSVATLERALDLGVTLLDTSMSYGGGHNERLAQPTNAASPSRSSRWPSCSRRATTWSRSPAPNGSTAPRHQDAEVTRRGGTAAWHSRRTSRTFSRRGRARAQMCRSRMAPSRSCSSTSRGRRACCRSAATSRRSHWPVTIMRCGRCRQRLVIAGRRAGR
jgi:hypothetical protein